VVIGHSTKSIAQYVPKSSGVTNDHITKVVIPSSICVNFDIRVQSMTTYIWCKECHKLINKEMLHEECDPQVPVVPEQVKKSMGL
jgi:Zn finger protein HypA/HybF involved in hydrogenase expression